MAGSRSGSQGTEAQKSAERQTLSQRPDADLAPAPQASELPRHLLADGQGGQVDLLSNPEIPSVQRQRFATQIGRTQGNRHLQQVIERVSRRIATVARDPWDEPVPAGQNVPGSPGPGAIPPDLLQSVDLSTLSLDELRDRLDRIMETLIQVAHNSPDADFLEGQAIRIRQLLTEREVEETVQHELESFLEEFQNITVTVRWGEDTGGQSVQH